MILLFVEERQNAPSDLDSLTAQQLDEKFKEIMMKKRGTYVNIYIDNYSFYHSVCSHLVVHRGVSPNHLYMNCHVTLIKLREISSSLSKKKGSWLNLHCSYSKIQYIGEYLYNEYMHTYTEVNFTPFPKLHCNLIGYN